MLKKNNKGFSMVELLAVVAILGILSLIGIVSVQGIISNARVKYYESQEENLIMAGRSYLEINKQFIPKVSGQKTKVLAKDLINNKYIDGLKDYHKNSCDLENSYVQVFKYKEEYMYSAHLECPKDSFNTAQSATYDNLDIKISYSGKYSDKSAQVTFKIDENGKKNGIIYYAYTIYKDGVEMHTEKFEQKKYSAPITTTISLKDYVPSKIKIMVTAVNIYGYSITKTEPTDAFYDQKAPSCVIEDKDNPEKQESEKEWSEEKVIMVGCEDDKGGVGCQSDKVTKEFREESSKENGVDIIQILDRNNNQTNCKVAANIDTSAPSATLKLYKRTSSGGNDGTALATIYIDGKNKTTSAGTITSDNKNVVVDLNITKSILSNLKDTNNWLNKANYPYGLNIVVEYSDTGYVQEIEWKTNSENITNINAYNYKTLTKTTNNTKEWKTVTNSSSKTKNPANFSIQQEGYRYGEITLKDSVYKKAEQGGTINNLNYPHQLIIRLSASLDRTAPTTPTVGLYKWNTSKPTSSSNLSKYEAGTWSNKNIYTQGEQSTDSLSGFSHYRYSTTGSIGENNNEKGSNFSIIKDGTSTIQYNACDRAGNCSSNSSSKTVKIDTTPPVLNVVAYKRTSSGSYTGSSIGSIKTTITSTSKSLSSYSNMVNNWLNSSNYPYGVYYKITTTDEIGVKTLKWEYNSSNLKATDTKVLNLTGSSNKSVSGTSATSNTYFSDDGYRIGKLTLTDLAGNTAVVDIAAPIDRTAPTTPSVSLYKWNTNQEPSSTYGLSTYSEGSNSNKKIYTIASNATDSMSGMGNYQYTTSGAQGTNTNKNGSSYSITKDGTSYISYKVCDKAENCNTTKDYKIKIDITAPTIEVIAYKRTSSGSYSGSSVGKKSTNSSATLSAYSNAYNGWLNNSNYPYGIYYVIKVSDSNYLKNLTIKYNDPSLTSSNYRSGILSNQISYDLTGYKDATKYFDFGGSGEGHRIAEITLTDDIGNQSVVNIVASMDRTAPTCSNSNEPEAGKWSSSGRNIYTLCVDGMSSCQSSPGNKYYDTTTDYVNYSLIDYAGNSSSCHVNVYVDKDDPVCGEVLYQSNSWSNNDRTVYVACSDVGSGCKEYWNGNTWNYTVDRDYIYIRDNSERFTTCPVDVYVDKSAPFTPYYRISYVENAIIKDEQINIGEYNTTDRSISYTISKPRTAIYQILAETYANDSGSGIAYFEEKYWCDDGSDTSLYTYTELRDWTRIDQNFVGNRYSRNGATRCHQYIRAVDHVGNVGPVLEINETIERY